jgi:hypothetical protein
LHALPHDARNPSEILASVETACQLRRHDQFRVAAVSPSGNPLHPIRADDLTSARARTSFPRRYIPAAISAIQVVAEIISR